MNRAIKFRLWSKLTNSWADGPFEYQQFGRFFEFDDAIREFYDIEQFTGLKDKNGVEIYEGDICNVEGPLGKQEHAQIKWGKYSDGEYVKDLECWIHEGFQNTPLSCIVNSIGVKYGRALQTVSGTIEIIGNIHENPDLLSK